MSYMYLPFNKIIFTKVVGLLSAEKLLLVKSVFLSVL
jgi:hypothetical protein